MNKDELIVISEKKQVDIIMKKNDALMMIPGGANLLSRQDAELLVKAKHQTLKELRVVELGDTILQQLHYLFCDSGYIMQKDYRDTLIRLQEIFFRVRDEVWDLITDEELMDTMHEYFEKRVGGDLDALDVFMDEYSQTLRADVSRKDGREKDQSGWTIEDMKLDPENLLYTPEEMYPIVLKLASKYCSYERTIISYDTMQKLMGAVIYTLSEVNSEEMTPRADMSAEEAFELGRREIDRKMKEVRKIYVQLAKDRICGFGIMCILESLRGVRQFIQDYESGLLVYEPQKETGFLTYPARGFDPNLTGVDAVHRFMVCFLKEQALIRKYPVQELKQKLMRYGEGVGFSGIGDEPDYRELYISIAEACELPEE
ncbi:MAG: DUF6323 family protein [Eubacterium sp.]|nr:DUF6323 family protein [Eubacterium sp.]